MALEAHGERVSNATETVHVPATDIDDWLSLSAGPLPPFAVPSLAAETNGAASKGAPTPGSLAAASARALFKGASWLEPQGLRSDLKALACAGLPHLWAQGWCGATGVEEALRVTVAANEKVTARVAARVWVCGCDCVLFVNLGGCPTYRGERGERAGCLIVKRGSV